MEIVGIFQSVLFHVDEGLSQYKRKRIVGKRCDRVSGNCGAFLYLFCLHLGAKSMEQLIPYTNSHRRHTIQL